jgi:hypothetical protein
LSGKPKVNRVFLLIGVVPLAAVRTGGTPEHTSCTLRGLSSVPGGGILAARTDGPTQDQGNRP